MLVQNKKANLRTRLDRSPDETFYWIGWINCTFQDIFGQNFLQYKLKKSKPRNNEFQIQKTLQT